ncbi:uncharacterized protein [Aristolochia californica]|uniref:uncharacterized protein n=1 Tax=Aristolochia californica TaxID=171875 RepID=UPI0035E052A4
MIALTILSLYLLLLFVLVTLSLLISLLFLAWWRRRFRRETSTAAPSEMSTEPYKSPSKEMLYYFCWKNQARVEPAGAWAASDTGSPTKMQEAEDFDKLYSRSRILYTIDEEKETETETEMEEERYISEETESFHGGTETGIDGYGLADLDIENDPQQFYSPLSSPQFYTPYSSPSRGRSPEREAAEVSGMPEVRVKIPTPMGFPAADDRSPGDVRAQSDCDWNRRLGPT